MIQGQVLAIHPAAPQRPNSGIDRDFAGSYSLQAFGYFEGANFDDQTVDQ
jgi:hypothetical protein